MTLFQVLLIVFIVYMVTAILLLFSYPHSKKSIDSTTAKGLETYIPREKRPYFSIHYFSSGWDVAKTSLPQFILFVILSPIIFISWLLWKFFGREVPEDFERSFPPRHPGGRPKGGAYQADDDAVKMILEDELSFEETFRNLRPRYFTDEQWEGLHDDYQKKKAFSVWKRRINRMISNDQ